MKTRIIAVLITGLTLGAAVAQAQQAPLYTHYMYNTLVVNPAYAGSRDALTVTGLHRSQWVGFDGAPMTQTLTLHSPLRNEHWGLGLSLSNDKIGPTNNTSVFADVAYRMQISKKSKLAIGISAGINLFQADLNGVQLNQQGDQAFAVNIENHVAPNVGAGIYYSRERFYVGLSVPNILQNNYSKFGLSEGTPSIDREQRHYFAIIGTVIPITENFAFKPTAQVKFTEGAPVQADLTAAVIIVKRLLLGGMWRSGDAVGGLIGVDITRQFHLGYSFDWSYGLKTGSYNYGSHEIVLRYDFLLFGNKQIHSPRYF